MTLKKSFNITGLFFLVFKMWRLNSAASDAPSCSVIQCQCLEGVEKLWEKFLAQNVFFSFSGTFFRNSALECLCVLIPAFSSSSTWSASLQISLGKPRAAF